MSDKASSEMTFLDHLEELRWHLIRSVVAVSIFAIAAFVFKTIVFDVIFLGPSDKSFITNTLLCQLGICINELPMELLNYEMAGQFLTHIKISIISGVVIAFPYIVWEIWKFVAPALYQNERSVARRIIFIIWFLFFLGVAFGYFVICPLSVNFLVNYQVTELAENKIRIMSYVSTIASISLAAGILFQLPVFVFFLTKIGLLTPQVLKKYRRHSLVVILLLSAIITPPDIFSQVLVSVPLLILYEIGIAISKRVLRLQEKRNKS